MINLIPPATRSNISAARTNKILLNYIYIVLTSIGFLAVVCGAIYLVESSSLNNSSRYNLGSSSSTNSGNTSVDTQLSDYRSKFQQAQNIINQSTNYSSVLEKIAEGLPTGVIIAGINLSQDMFSKSFDIQAYAKDSNAASSFTSSIATSHIFSSATVSTLTPLSSPMYNNYTVSFKINAKIIKVSQ